MSEAALRLPAREALQAWVTRRIGHGQRYVVTRRYFTDGRVVQSVNEGAVDDQAADIEVGRFSDLTAAEHELLRNGWALVDRSNWLAVALEFVARVTSLTAVGTFWLAPSVGLILGTGAAVLAFAHLLVMPVRLRAIRGGLLFGVLGASWYPDQPAVRAGAFLLLVLLTWTIPARGRD